MRPQGLAYAKAGRETGELFFVVENDGKTVLLTDGRRRKLAAPKKKSLRHVELLSSEEFELAAAGLGGEVTDRQIIRALAAYRAGLKQRREGTEVWQRTI